MSLPVRLGRPSDMAFVVSSWLHSYESGPPFRGAPYEHYKAEMTRAIRRLCDRAELRVAYDPKDDDHIVGYAAFRGTELHYLYVKKDFRRDVRPEHLLVGAAIDAFTFRGRHMQDALEGYQGCAYTKDAKGETTWNPPTGWRYTPRITI